MRDTFSVSVACCITWIQIDGSASINNTLSASRCHKSKVSETRRRGRTLKHRSMKLTVNTGPGRQDCALMTGKHTFSVHYSDIWYVFMCLNIQKTEVSVPKLSDLFTLCVCVFSVYFIFICLFYCSNPCVEKGVRQMQVWRHGVEEHKRVFFISSHWLLLWIWNEYDMSLYDCARILCVVLQTSATKIQDCPWYIESTA